MKTHKRFNLGICAVRIMADAAGFIIATLIFLEIMNSSKADLRLFLIFGYLVCIAIVAFDLYFVIKDIRFIRNGNRDRKPK